MLDEVGYVYMFYNQATGYGYVGSTKDEQRRFKEHVSDLNNNRHGNPKFQRAYNKDPNFEFYSVPVSSREDASALEQLLIHENWGNPKLLNLAYDVSSPRIGVEISAETREKHRQYQLGRTMSAEAVEKNRLSRLEQWKDPDYREKQRLARTGSIRSEEHRANIRAASNFTAAAVPVSVDGVRYDSVMDAAKSLNVPYTTACKRFKSEGFPDWKRL